MRVLILSLGADVAGNGVALARALTKAGVEARAVCRRPSRYGYPVDILWNNRRAGYQVAALFEQADVIWTMEYPSAVRSFPRWQGKRIVVQQLGSRFRDDPRGMVAACRAMGALLVAGVPDRHYVSPPLPFMCGAFDLEAIAEIRRQTFEPSERVRIVHAPTKRALKSTDALIAAVDRLSKRYPVDLDIIEGLSWKECLERKAHGDILFDQTLYGFGANAIEAWAMGIPVIAGCQDEKHLAAMKSDYGEPAFVEATEDTIEQALEPLVADAALREEWGERGRWFAERTFSDRVVAERALTLIAQAGQVAA